LHIFSIVFLHNGKWTLLTVVLASHVLQQHFGHIYVSVIQYIDKTGWILTLKKIYF